MYCLNGSTCHLLLVLHGDLKYRMHQGAVLKRAKEPSGINNGACLYRRITKSVISEYCGMRTHRLPGHVTHVILFMPST